MTEPPRRQERQELRDSGEQFVTVQFKQGGNKTLLLSMRRLGAGALAIWPEFRILILCRMHSVGWAGWM
jgi:hypothetical protein